MKKLFAAFCCMILLVTTAVSADAAAAKMQLIPSESKLKPGDTFYVEAKLENTELVNYCTVKLEYDEKKLELTGGKCEVDTDGGIGSVVADANAGTLMFLLPKKLSGTIFTFRFRVKDQAEAGQLEIHGKATLKKDEYIDVADAKVQILGEKAEVTVPTEGKEEDQPTATVTTPTQPMQETPTQTATMPEETQASTAATQPTIEETQQPTTQPEANTEIPTGVNPVPVILAIVVAAAAAVAVILIRKKK